MQVRDRWVLITGGAQGIGAEIALQLGEKGAQLLIADQDRPAADRFCRELSSRGVVARSYGVDVSAREEVTQLQRWTVEEGIDVDLLINNAGILEVGGFLETSPQAWDRLISVNLLGVVQMTQAFLPAMLERKEGFVVNIASAAGRIGLAALTGYSTSKFAVVGLSQAMDGEFRTQGVGVCAICPGFVQTDIMRRGQLTPEKEEEIAQFLAKRGSSPHLVGRAVLDAIEKEKRLVSVGLDARALGLLSRLVPSHASDFIRRLSRS